MRVLAGFPGPAAAGMRLSESSNGAAPGRCAHHPGITPGGVICGDRDSPMGRGVRVAGPRVPAGTLISRRPGRRPGIILRGDVISPVRQATLPRQGLIGDGARVFSRRTVSQRPGNSGPSTPVTGSYPLCPSAPAQAHRPPPGGANLVYGRRPCPHERHPSKDQECRGTQRAGNMPKGSVEPGNLRACRGGPLLELAGLAEAGGEQPGAPAACQRTRASGTGSTLHPRRVGGCTAISWRWDGHALFGPMRLRRRAARDAALPGAAAAGFTLPRVIGR